MSLKQTIVPKLSLAVLAATTAAITACAEPEENSGSTDTAISRIASLTGGGCTARNPDAPQASFQQFAVEFVREDKARITIYDDDGRYQTEGEFSVKRLSNGDVDVVDTGSSGSEPMVWFRLKKTARGYGLQFPDYSTSVTSWGASNYYRGRSTAAGMIAWDRFEGPVACTFGGSVGAPALAKPLPLLTPQAVPQGFEFTGRLSTSCTATKRNGTGHLVDVEVRNESGGTCVDVFVYDTKGHLTSRSGLSGVQSAGKLELHKRQVVSCEPTGVVVGAISTDRQSDRKYQLNLKASEPADLGSDSIALHCE